MSDYATEATEYLRGERAPWEHTVESLAGLLYHESLVNPAWTKLSRSKWKQAIEEAIKTGLIENRDGKIAVAEEKTEVKYETPYLF